MYTAREAANFYYLGIEIIGSTVVAIAMTAALIYRSSAAACGLAVAMAMFYGVHRFILREKLQRAGSERDHSLRLLQRSLAEMFSSGKEIRSHGIEAFFHNRIARHARSAAASYQSAGLLQQTARILADQGVVLLFLCVVIVVQARHGDTRQLLSLLVYYFVLSRRLVPLVSQVSFMAGQMESSRKNVQIVAEELDDCSLHRTVAPAPQAMNSTFVLELDQVSFSFGDGPSILKDVTLRVGRGEVVVLHGASGSGKSSLLNLAAGVLQPTAGVVRADCADVAYVPQDTALLDDTVRNNLLFGMPSTSDAELRDALELADLTEFVAAQPLGLGAPVGDNGVLFSGGQRQRLGLARAVLRGASLLLLDEATSALDEENESQVLENLSASGVAVLLVTHRALKQDFADRVFRLEEGRLMEEAIEVMSVPSAPVEPVEVAF
jgi:ABC-type multidrug transport system fused ATPase/permease subunit